MVDSQFSSISKKSHNTIRVVFKLKNDIIRKALYIGIAGDLLKCGGNVQCLNSATLSNVQIILADIIAFS
jgi:hypothetical protein